MSESMNPAWTSLHHAVTDEEAGLAKAKLALDAGVPVDARTKDAFQATALHRAPGHGRAPGMITMLVEAGADIDAQNSRGRTPLHLAYRYDAPKWVIEELLASGADPDARDALGLAPHDLLDVENR